MQLYDAYMKHHQALFLAKAKYHVDDGGGRLSMLAQAHGKVIDSSLNEIKDAHGKVIN